ncbi:hypothetical protein JCM3766R1_001204 [Sporobolomyces carnicolor]
MDSDSDIVYDSEPERRAQSRIPSQTPVRNHLRRTSDERPEASGGEGSNGEREPERMRRTKSKVVRTEEILVLDSGSEEAEGGSTRSRYFSTSASPPRRRRLAPSSAAPADPQSPEGWPFSGPVRIGSRSPPLTFRRASSGSVSADLSTAAATNFESGPAAVASSSKISIPAKASSPFTSALDLLHSRTTSTGHNSPRLSSRRPGILDSPPPPERKSKSRTARARSLVACASASSIEILEENPDGESRPTKEGDPVDLDARGPETWAEQFKLGSSKSSKSSSSKGKAKVKDECAPQIQEGKKRKPWEALEAKVPSSGTQKKKPTTRSKPRKVTQSQYTSDDAQQSKRSEPEDDDLQVLAPTALKPCPSGRLSHPAASSSAAFVKKKATRSMVVDEIDVVTDVKTALILPGDDRLKCLSHCPLCAFTSSEFRPQTSINSWGSKSLASRQTHLRMCAKSNDYNSETVAHLVNQQILILSIESEQNRLERDLEKTLFDRAIGKGEGTAGREVTVVGMEATDGVVEGDKKWASDIKDVQAEVDAWRKKSKKGGIEARLAAVAKDIKRELELARSMSATESETASDRASVESELQGYCDKVPRATGRLRPETDLDREQVSKRAQELLDLARATQKVKQPFGGEDVSMDDAKGRQGQDSSFELPRSTQSFEASTLANRCQHDGAIEVIRPLPSPVRAAKSRSRSPLDEIDLLVSSDEEGMRRRATSLWRANTGKDEASISRIVRSPSASDLVFSASRSKSPSPPRRTPSPRQRDLAPHLSTLTLSSGTSSSSSLVAPSVLLGCHHQLGSSRGLVTSTRRSPSRSPTRARLLNRDGAMRGSDEFEDEVEGGEAVAGWMNGCEEGWGPAGAVLTGGAEEEAGRRGVGGAESSSEEESLANLLARTPSKSAPRRIRTTTQTTATTLSNRRRISPSSPVDEADLASESCARDARPARSTSSRPRVGDPPGMPAYSSLPLSTLQKEVQKYGYRPSKEKSVVVQQLKNVWRALNKATVEAWERGELDQARPGARKGKGSKRQKAVNPDLEAQVSSSQTTKTKGRRKRRVIVDDSAGDEVGDDNETTVGERLRDLIVNDEHLYLRILRYEPIHLDEFILLAANNNVKVARALLIRCLDEQSITFYQEDPTNGQRKRHR